MADAKRDSNFVPTLLAVSSVDQVTPVTLFANPTTHRLLVSSTALSSSLQTDTFSTLLNQTTFASLKTNAFTIYFSINGVIQTPGSDYTTTTTSATLTTPVPGGNIVAWVYATT